SRSEIFPSCVFSGIATELLGRRNPIFALVFQTFSFDVHISYPMYIVHVYQLYFEFPRMEI
ncbi:Unknown protein, partial [Striga hermonthica]